MAVNRNTSGLRTGIDISSGKSRASSTNNSSARKFTAKDNFQNNDSSVGDVRSNSEHIVDHAAGLKATGMVVAKAADVALQQLQATRAQLQSVSSANQGTTKNPSFDDHDLKIAQGTYINEILNRLGSQAATSTKQRIEDHTYDLVHQSVSNFLPVTLKGDGTAVNASVPSIDHVTVDMHLVKGVLDIFFSSVQFSIPQGAIASGKIKAIRIFRAEIANPDFFLRQPARLSVAAVERLCAQPLRSKRKNQDYLGQYERQLSDMSVDNALSALNPTDPLRKLRAQSSDERITATDHLSAVDKQQGDGVISAHLSSFLDPRSFTNLDQSVAVNLLSLKNLQLQNPHLALKNLPPGVQVGKAAIISNAGRLGKEAIRQNRSNFTGGKNPLVVEKANKPDFKEIAFISPDKLNGRIIGDQVEYTFEDYTIQYAKSYRYYIVTVDNNMAESQRSGIVQINVDGLRIPQAPTRCGGYIIGNAICVSTSVDDLLVEKFEIYRKNLTGIRTVGGTSKISVLNNSSGYHVSDEIRSQLPNGFMQIGEALNRAGTGGVFYDRNTQPGNKYVYRVYSVDIFGNKSEAPKEFQIFWPEATKHVDLATPHIMSEVDSLTGKVKLTFQCDDTRVTRLFLARRDVSLGQSAFVPPGQIEHIKMGRTSHMRGAAMFDDVRFGYDADKQLLWNGLFENNQQQNVFYDKTAVQEHTYQYQLYGIDRFGNKTPYAQSPMLFIANAALVYEPRNLQCIVIPAGNAQIAGVQINWDDSNISISAEDMVGNQKNLQESAVRTLFQVSRRKIGEDQWFDFPLVSDQTFFDQAASPDSQAAGQPPASWITPTGYAEQQYLRNIGTQQSASIAAPLSPLPQQPPQIVQNETYVYRIQAFQSGNFVSNYSTQVVINASVPVTSPINFRVKPTDSKTRPFYVALNWDTSADSGIIDRWEIERAIVNNFAAAKLNNLNSADFSALQYTPFKTVYMESSRFRERTDDDDESKGLLGGLGASDMLSGQHHYVDQQVEFGNTYFYRIRSISVAGGQSSDWVYRGVKITDDSYEKKQNAILTPTEKTDLSSVPTPINMKTDFFSPKSSTAITSLTSRSIPALPPTPVPYIAATMQLPAPTVPETIRSIPAPPITMIALPPAPPPAPPQQMVAVPTPKPSAQLARLDTSAAVSSTSKSFVSQLASKVLRR